LSKDTTPVDVLLSAFGSHPECDLSFVTRGQYGGADGIRLFDAVTLSVDHHGRWGLALMDILVDEGQRQRGFGTKAMNIFLKIADDLDEPVNLYARPHSRSPLNRLELAQWYERMAFVETPRGHRRPQKSLRLSPSVNEPEVNAGDSQDHSAPSP